MIKKSGSLLTDEERDLIRFSPREDYKFHLERQDAKYAAVYYLLYYSVNNVTGKYPLYSDQDVSMFKAYCEQFLGIDNEKCHGEFDILQVYQRSFDFPSVSPGLVKISNKAARDFFDKHFNKVTRGLRGRHKMNAIHRVILEIRNSILERQGDSSSVIDLPEVLTMSIDNNNNNDTESVVVSDVNTDRILQVSTRDEFRDVTGIRFRMTREMQSKYVPGFVPTKYPKGEKTAWQRLDANVRDKAEADAFADYMENLRRDPKMVQELVAKISNKQKRLNQ